MQIQRVPPVLQTVALARNWVVQNVPITNSMLGYDLFIMLGNVLPQAQQIDLTELANSLSYPADQVAEHVEKMAKAGLLVLDRSTGGTTTVRPSEAFLDLLDRYRRMIESLFVLRADLHNQQLFVSISNSELGVVARTMYDRFYDLGWIYSHNFGSSCFLMASLVCRVAESHGYQARVASCYIESASPTMGFQVGTKGSGGPDQIDGHAVCVINESMIVDFGLGSLLRSYRRGFPWALVCDYVRSGNLIGALELPGEEIVLWKDDWQSPRSQAELEACEPHIGPLFDEYVARFG